MIKFFSLRFCQKNADGISDQTAKKSYTHYMVSLRRGGRNCGKQSSYDGVYGGVPR